MSIHRPPLPTGNDWKFWADQIHRYLLEQQSTSVTDRKAVALAHRTPTSTATQDGLLMWDATLQRVVVSRGGQWRALRED